MAYLYNVSKSPGTTEMQRGMFLVGDLSALAGRAQAARGLHVAAGPDQEHRQRLLVLVYCPVQINQ